MNPKISKAVILTAGLGTRFLPMTKVIPKAMLPIGSKPVIQYLVEEAVNAGITEILFVNGRGHRMIEDHFSHSAELAEELEKAGKTELLQELKRIEKLAHFTYTIQEEPRGDGHALLLAQRWVNSEPFAVLFGDDIVDGPTSALAQIMEVYSQKGSPVLSVQTVPPERISSYGVIDIQATEGRQHEVKSLIEKPKPEEAPSSLGIIGKYICPPEIFNAIETATPSRDGELRLIDGLIHLLKQGHSIHALEIEGVRFDTGTQEGLLEAQNHFAKMIKIC